MGLIGFPSASNSRPVSRARSRARHRFSAAPFRFPRDAEILRNGGGTILEVVRPGYDTRDGSDLTERERKLIQPDSVILNNGSLAELQTCAATVWHDLVLRDLQANYSAHTGAPELSKSI